MPRDASAEGKVDGILSLFGYFLLFCGFVLLLAACWRAYRLHTTVTTWPAANAEVVENKVVQGRRPRGSQAQPYYYYADCLFRYSVKGIEYRARVRTGAAYSRQAAVNWVNEHLPGTRQVIYYDPSDFNRVNLAGADSGLTGATPSNTALSGLGFAGVGSALLLLARRMVARRKQAMAARSPGPATKPG